MNPRKTLTRQSFLLLGRCFPVCRSPLDSSSLLLLLEPDVLELQGAGDEPDLTALLHQAPDPPVVVELLRTHTNGDVFVSV